MSHIHTDWSCTKCRRRFGLIGESDHLALVTCPYCGHKWDASSDLAVIQKFRDELARRSQSEWDARTPDQEASFEAGRVAFRKYEADGLHPDACKVRLSILAAKDRCPYPDLPHSAQQNPLRHWWYRGWTHEEFEPPRRKQPAENTQCND